jgi:hypothetical protein
MEILNLSGNNGVGSKKSSRSRAFIGIGVIAAAIGLSSTLAANISINSGPVEFGQGVAQTVACSGDESVIVTPATTFSNEGADINTVITEHDSGPYSGAGWLQVASTAGITVGMVVSDGDGPVEVNSVVVGFGDNGVYISKVTASTNGIPIGGFPVTFSESRGTPATLTPNYGETTTPNDHGGFSISSSGLAVGMLVTGGGISANTVITSIGQDYIQLSKTTEWDGGDLTFTNSKSGVVGSFKLSDITVSGIPDTCNGKVFTIKLYDNESAEPIVVTDFSEPGYEEDSAIQVYWGNGYINDMPPSYAMIHFENYQWFLDNRDFDGGCIFAVGNCLETADTEGSNLPSNAFKVILPAPVNATRVYKITVESQDDASTFTSYPDVSGGDTSFTSSFEDFFIDYIRPSWND